jgi:CubicO group peptidase (beta-lactamase class C family)
MTRLACAAVLAALTLPGPALPRGEIDAGAIDAILKDTLEKWNAPGLAAAVVRGEEVYLKGVGVREAGKDDPVTPDTIFAYASLTKAFTAVALGILVDERKAHWDDLVRNYLDWFRLSDPLADRDVRLRDLLCHRTGLPAHDLLWYRASWSLEDAVRRMAHLEPTAGFRARYQYNNLGYIAAGLATSKAAGMPWEEFVQKRLLTPLGMKNAVFTAAEARARKDHATPHRRVPPHPTLSPAGGEGNKKKPSPPAGGEGRVRGGGKHSPIPWYPDEKQVRASGSLKGGARDLAAWMRLQLGDGAFEGSTILSAESLRETHTPQIVVPLPRDLARMTEATQSSYGLGWQIHDYRGRRVLEHGGSNDGFRARILLVPKAKLGIALLTNCEEADMLSAAAHRLLDQLLGLKEKDWVGFYKKRPSAEAKKPPVARIPGKKPQRELAAYAGVYRNPAYGDLTIKEDSKELSLAWSGFRAALPHFHYNTFEAKPPKEDMSGRLQGELATFALDGGGNVAYVVFLGRRWLRIG